MSYTSPIFHLRGDSLNAYVSQSGKTPAQFLSDSGTSAVATQASADTGAFGGSVIAKSSTTKVRSLAFPGFNNVSMAGFSVLMRLVPRFTGAPAFATGLAYFEGLGPGAATQGLALGVTTGGNLNVVLKDKYGTNYFNGSTVSGYTSYVSGTAVDLLAVWDGTTSNLTFYVNGTSIGTITPSAGSPAVDKKLIGILNVGMSTNGVLGNYDINEFAIWSQALSGADITALSARSAFIASTAFDGQNYTDPGIDNVRNGVAYTIAGVVMSGDLVVPSTADVRTGVTFGSNSGITGVYDGSDRWSDPGFANVKHNVSYKANSITNNETGTYIGNDEFSDPGAANVLTGVTYLANGVTQTGTLQLLFNYTTKLQLRQNPTVKQSFTMTQGDALTFQFQAIDDTDTAFDLTGASFSTSMAKTDGTLLTFGNSAHTANPDQVGHKGEFSLFMNGTDLLMVGNSRAIITKVTIGQDVIQFRGSVSVLPSSPAK